ncbi:MAG: DMT family transporter [Desulfovibrionaceae bacterium]
MNRRDAVLTYGALTGAVVFWGLSFVATKIALRSFDVAGLLGVRFTASGVLLLGWMWWRGFPKFSRAEHAKLFALAVFQPGLYFFFETMGVSHTTASKAGLIVAAVPIAVLALSAALRLEKATPVALGGIALSLVGIYFLITGGGDAALHGGSLLGDLFMCGAVAAAAVYMVMVRRLSARHSTVDITCMQMVYGAVFFVPLLFTNGMPGMASFSMESLGALGYLVVLCSIGAFLFYNYALAKVPASQASLAINGVPVVTALGAWVMLGETLTLTQAAGGALVLCAVCMTNMLAGRAPATQTA